MNRMDNIEESVKYVIGLIEEKVEDGGQHQWKRGTSVGLILKLVCFAPMPHKSDLRLASTLPGL